MPQYTIDIETGAGVDQLVDAIQIRLMERMFYATQSICDRAAEEYRSGLTATIAPPHSAKGKIPHAYFGWKDGGYGPVNLDNWEEDPFSFPFGEGASGGGTRINNTAKQGFASDQSDYLANSITWTTEVFGESSVVGWKPSHVTSRAMNYLLKHDRTGRPWRKPLYDQMRAMLKREFMNQLKRKL